MIQLKLKENQNKLKYIPQYDLIDTPTPGDWAIFTALQVADVYTTYRGLKYNCVKEINPLVGERPSIGQMVFLKFATLTPAVQIDYNRGMLTRKVIRNSSSFIGVVVLNNYDVLRRAEKYCSKR